MSDYPWPNDVALNEIGPQRAAPASPARINAQFTRWLVGDFTFYYTYCQDGALVMGNVGTHTVIEEVVSAEHPIKRVMDQSRFWVMDYLQKQYVEAVNCSFV